MGGGGAGLVPSPVAGPVVRSAGVVGAEPGLGGENPINNLKPHKEKYEIQNWI